MGLKIFNRNILGCEDDSGWSSPELDVVSCTPGPGQSSTSQSSTEDPNNHKRYFCQRCLNHLLEYPRKGHKPFCR